MSKHVFDFLKVQNDISLSTGTISTTGNADLQLVPVIDRDAVCLLSGKGNMKIDQGGLSKIAFTTGTSLTTTTGMNSLNIFSGSLSSAAYGGLKVFVTVSNASAVMKRFDEYSAMVSVPASGQVARLYQLSSVNSGTIASPSSSMTAGTTTNSGLVFSYSFPATSVELVNIGCFVEWYGSSLARFAQQGIF